MLQRARRRATETGFFFPLPHPTEALRRKLGREGDSRVSASTLGLAASPTLQHGHSQKRANALNVHMIDEELSTARWEGQGSRATRKQKFCGFRLFALFLLLLPFAFEVIPRGRRGAGHGGCGGAPLCGRVAVNRAYPSVREKSHHWRIFPRARANLSHVFAAGRSDPYGTRRRISF